MKRICIAFAGCLGLVPCSAHAAAWVVDPATSSIGFSGTQLGTPFQGRFKSFSAKIEFDPAHPENGHATVLIDIASAETGDKQRDEALPQPEWFDALRFSRANFEAVRFHAEGVGRYDAIGNVTIRGVRRDVTLPFRMTIVDGQAHAVGHLRVSRTAFGVGQGDWSTSQWVALEVGIDIDIRAVRAESK